MVSQAESKNQLDIIPPEILKKQIVIYFETQKADSKQPALTLPALALSLAVPLKDIIAYPETGIHYPIITNAKARCENDLVERMFDHRIDKTTGLMFLKNHFGYIDIAKALTAEEKLREKKANISTKRSISDILDAIEQKQK